VSEIALSFDRVSKKFRRGELHDSLRDLVPALVRRVWRRPAPERLGAQEFWALDEVSFDVPRGEAFGIIGRNGAGKSTALKLLSGIMNPTRGRLTVRGRLSALIEVGAGFHPDLTGRENIFLNGAILGMSRSEIARKFDEIVAFSGLEAFLDTPVKRYSSGMFARLGFSVAAHLEPDVLVIDEVLSVGDTLFQKKGVDKMHEIATSGATVVFVSHNLKAVADLCDRCLLLEQGRVATIGPTSDVIHEYLKPARDRSGETATAGVHIAAVTVRRPGAAEEAPEVRFDSGDLARVDIDIVAAERVTDLAIGLKALDESHYHLFDTSSQRLGYEPLTLEAGERVRVTFNVVLNFASGTFHFGSWIYRYDIQRRYDEWDAAATIFVAARSDVRGVVNLQPRVTVQRLHEPRPGRAAPADAS